MYNTIIVLLYNTYYCIIQLQSLFIVYDHFQNTEIVSNNRIINNDNIGFTETQINPSDSTCKTIEKLIFLATRFIQPQASGPIKPKKSLLPGPKKYVAWLTFSLLLWRQLLWNTLDVRKIQFCVANVISFSYNKEPLMSKMELRVRETFVNKIICSVDS